jgi:hypothetical protein
VAGATAVAADSTAVAAVTAVAVAAVTDNLY